MVIDASAIVAILFDEPERPWFAAAIDAAALRLLSAATFVEATLVVEGRKGRRAERMVDRFVEDGEIEVIPVTIEQVQLACEAFRAFGKAAMWPLSIWAIASLTRSPRQPASRCSSRVRISPRLISDACCRDLLRYSKQSGGRRPNAL